MGAEIVRRGGLPVPGPRSHPPRHLAARVTAPPVEPTEPTGPTGPDTSPPERSTRQRFEVRLDNFEGPFDLLLTLIGQHRLDVTEVALHRVTDEFIAYTRELGAAMELDQTTEFLVVAATLLDLKAARLLPAGDVDDAEDLALLEVRDLLFARLLQYRAYKQVAQLFGELENAALRRYPRSVSLEERFDGLLPEVLLGVDPTRFAEIAAAAFRPREIPTVGLGHLHEAPVSVAEHAATVLAMLRERGEGAWTEFADLVADCTAPVEIVVRFLALLELYREKAVTFDQPEALGALQVRWTGDDDDLDTTRMEDYG
ncbi:segregation/condensation protein A [Rhodococcus corynebacterioides]|nr:segregation/condensation protein A [Rhodococcus corynebacterioides]